MSSKQDKTLPTQTAVNLLGYCSELWMRHVQLKIIACMKKVIRYDHVRWTIVDTVVLY